jgi:putative transposase
MLQRRWIVERTLGRLGRWRCLSRDCEHLPEVSEAMIRRMLQCAVHPNRRRLAAP